MAELVVDVAVFFGVLAVMMVSALLASRAIFHDWASNWSKALKSLPVPADVGERSRWRSSWFRDNPETRIVVPCVVSYSEQGILVRDFWYQMCFWGLCCKHRTMFIPWTACSDPREPGSRTRPPFHPMRGFVELDVAGQPFSILVHSASDWGQAVNSE